MADRLPVPSLIEDKLRMQSDFVRARRRSALRERSPLPPASGLADAHRTTGYEPVQQILQDVLRSACEVIAAGQAFILVSRDRTVLEVAATHEIHPAAVMHAVLSQASQPVHAALYGKIMAAGDLHGAALPVVEGAVTASAPAVLCVPLDLGPNLRGALCLLRQQRPSRLSDLDLEIVQALAEQAALAIGAASHSSALSRLQASLSSLSPAYA